MGATYHCRIAKLKVDGSWEYKVLDLLKVGYNAQDSDKVFHPMLLRSISTILTVSGDTGHIEAQRFPTIIVDFGQVDEKIPFSFVHVGVGSSEGDKFIECMTYFSQIREWLQHARLVSTNKLYLQFFVTNADDDDDPQVKFDPQRIPLGSIPGLGWRGVPSNLQLTDFEAGDGSIQLSLTWQVGIVIPI